MWSRRYSPADRPSRIAGGAGEEAQLVQERGHLLLPGQPRPACRCCGTRPRRSRRPAPRPRRPAAAAPAAARRGSCRARSRRRRAAAAIARVDVLGRGDRRPARRPRRSTGRPRTRSRRPCCRRTHRRRSCAARAATQSREPPDGGSRVRLVLWTLTQEPVADKGFRSGFTSLQRIPLYVTASSCSASGLITTQRSSGRRRSSASSRIATPSRDLVGAHRARRHDVDPVEVGERPQPALACRPRRTRSSARPPAPVALNGTSGSRVARSRTSSSAQNTPSPRTSPTLGCRSASSRSAGPITSSPSARACSMMPSSLKIWIEATADAQASGCPE